MTNNNEEGASTARAAAEASSSIEKYVLLIEDLMPLTVREKVGPVLRKALPFLLKVVEVIEKLLPYLALAHQKLLELWKIVEPYHPELLIPSACGIILCFFGGSFVTIIAAVEAYRMCGYETSVKSINQLISDAKTVIKKFKEDDEVDADKDGIKDVSQISTKDLLVRKTLLVLRTVKPETISDALQSIQAGFLAVVATLKLEFAKTITLGNSIAGMIETPADKYLVPLLESALSDDYKKWAKPTLNAVIQSTSLSLAWTLQRVISAVHSAMRGGLMCSRNLLEYLSKEKIIQINHEDTYLDELLGYLLAALGLYFQLSRGFSLPFPFNLVLFPFTLAEYFLVWMVGAK